MLGEAPPAPPHARQGHALHRQRPRCSRQQGPGGLPAHPGGEGVRGPPGSSPPWPWNASAASSGTRLGQDGALGWEGVN